MAEAAVPPLSQGATWKGTWQIAALGVGLTGLASLCRGLGLPSLTVACLPLVVVGLVLAARAAERALRQLREDWNPRLEVACLLGVVSLGPLFGYLAMD